VVELSHDSRPIIGRGTPLGAAFLALATASIGLMVADVRYDQLERVRGWMNSAAYPLQLAIDLPFSAWASIAGWFADSDRLRQQNLELTAQLRDANLQLQRFDALEQENQRLREMRSRSATVAKRAIVASILKVDLDPFRHRVLLDRGASDGVFKGQTVLDAQGIFGQIWRVNARTSEAILISDAEHAIPVKSNRSGVRTIAVGTGDPDRLSLPFVTGESDIRKGDLLISTGMGGVFPPGYPVATVTKVERSAKATFAIVEARPAAALDRDSEVMLVWFDAPQPGPEGVAEDPAAAATLHGTDRAEPTAARSGDAASATAAPAAATSTSPASTAADSAGGATAPAGSTPADSTRVEASPAESAPGESAPLDAAPPQPAPAPGAAAGETR
jgi:rod shape-determining protein MreC